MTKEIFLNIGFSVMSLGIPYVVIEILRCKIEPPFLILWGFAMGLLCALLSNRQERELYDQL